MKALFHSLVLLATAAGVYFSYDLSKKFQEQQDIRLEKIDKNKKVTADAESTEAELRKERDRLAKAKDDETAGNQTVNGLKSAQVGLKKQLAEQDAILAEQKVQLDTLTKAIEAAKDALKDLGNDINFDNIADKVKELQNKKLELEKTRDDRNTLVDGATKKRDGQKAEVARLSDLKTQRDTRIARNAMESTITGVNQEWGFVMIGAGSNTGFSPQTKLLVKRDGRIIGVVRPTSIEPTQTLANIDFDSLAPGVRLQAGDSVILADPVSN